MIRDSNIGTPFKETHKRQEHGKNGTERVMKILKLVLSSNINIGQSDGGLVGRRRDGVDRVAQN
jgi:hypothetical protein